MRYSQNSEDKFVFGQFDAAGVLLEIGANDGTTFSNSKMLIEMGWEAHLIEPGSVCGDLFLLHKDNPKVHIYNYGIGEKEEKVKFWESGAHVPNGTDTGLVSTTDFEETKRWPAVKFTEREIQLVPWDKFYENIDKPKIDFISIDAEGFDEKILNQIDLNEVGCRVLCIEWNSVDELKKRFIDYCSKYDMRLSIENAENLIFTKCHKVIPSDELPKSHKIGIGVTTANPEKYLSHMVKWDGLILFNTDQNGIARDKNKLIKQLYILGCDYIILFDDDTFPIKEGWAEWLIEQECDHAVLGEQIPGCMLFMNRKVVETVGYMNPAYGKYGWEHLGYFNRIQRAGSISLLPGWEEYFYSYDLQGAAHGFEKIEWQTQAEKEERSKKNQLIFEAENRSEQLYYPYEVLSEPKKERTGKLQVMYMYMYESDPTFYYRLAVMKYINSRDMEITKRPYGGEITWATIQQYDVLVLERPSGIHDLQMIKLAKQVGVRVISDWDDNVLEVDIYNPMYAQLSGSKENIMEALYLSDEVWVTTNGLKNAFSLFNNNIHVIPNALNDFLQPVNQKKAFNPKGKTAVWRGGQAHEADVYSYQKELVRIIKKNKKWAFVFFGDRFMGIQMQCEGSGNIIPVSPKPLMEYFDKMHKLNPQIVYHPLRDTEFNRSKSNIAFLEATYVGAAFFGNKNLPEFDLDCIFGLELLNEALTNNNVALQQANTESWKYICDNLLLSITNKIREARLLEI